MKIVSTNLSTPTEIIWNGKKEYTGIYKYPIDGPIRLERTNVRNDAVIDRRYHGGIRKACYLFSADTYPYWKEKYPNLDWQYGMFGENITLTEFDENSIYVGDTYMLGKALVRITEPREPCRKLGIRFQNQAVIKDFIAFARPGTYVEVLEEGEVQTGDTLTLVESSGIEFSVTDYFNFHYHKDARKQFADIFFNNPFIKEEYKEKFRRVMS